MEHWLIPSVVGIPAFFIYFVAGVSLLILVGAVFWKLTPHDEIALIREGNIAAAIGFGGAMVGVALPLSRAIAQASSIPDLLVWSFVALMAQILAFYVVSWLIPGVSDRVAKGDMASGAFLGAIAVAVGLINAASMTV